MARKKLSGTPEYRQTARLLKDSNFLFGDDKMGSRERRRSEERKRARADRKKKRQARQYKETK